MKTFRLIIVTAILTVSSTVFASASGNTFVSHFEPLQRMSSGPTALSFDALGRTFDLQLKPNDRLLSSLPREVLTDGIEIYRGQLAGRPDSWARIVIYDGMPRGIIWDGKEMFAIEAPSDSSLQTTTPVIYRLADMLIAPDTMTCGVESLPASGMGAYNKLIGEMTASKGMRAAQDPGAVSEITIGAIGDYEFTNAMGGDAGAAAAITTRLNNVDGYFSQQVGVQIRIAIPIETFNDPADPFTKSYANDLLNEVSTYREGSASQRAQGLTHLFTGRDLDTTTVGVAWLGTLCQDYFGAGLSQGTGGPTIDSLVAAHEIGHNFNAEHDGEVGSTCESELPAFIMAPSVNVDNDTFSACSIAVMEARVVAVGTSCVAPLPTVDMSISLIGQSATILLAANTVLSYDIRHNGTVQATNVAVDFTLPVMLSLGSVTTSMGTCSSGAGTVNCVLGDVPGLSNNTIDIATTPTLVGVGMLSATVSSDAIPDERPSNDQDDLQLTVNPAVDLVVNTPTASTIRIDESTTISAVLENRSTLPAIGATLNISLSSGLQLDSVSWPIGTCTITTQQIDCVAATFDAQWSSTLSVGVTGISTGSKSYTIALSSNEEEANPGDNSFSGIMKVNSPKDSGGGATSPMFLYLLAMLGVFIANRQSAIR